jgi:hypothetical protein
MGRYSKGILFFFIVLLIVTFQLVLENLLQLSLVLSFVFLLFLFIFFFLLIFFFLFGVCSHMNSSDISKIPLQVNSGVIGVLWILNVEDGVGDLALNELVLACFFCFLGRALLAFVFPRALPHGPRGELVRVDVAVHIVGHHTFLGLALRLQTWEDGWATHAEKTLAALIWLLNKYLEDSPTKLKVVGEVDRQKIWLADLHESPEFGTVVFEEVIPL